MLFSSKSCDGLPVTEKGNIWKKGKIETIITYSDKQNLLCEL